jgi:peptide deformylase
VCIADEVEKAMQMLYTGCTHRLTEENMTIRALLHFPHPVLRQPALPVTVFDAVLSKLVDDMFDTMYADDGVGLAANQVGELQRVITIDVSHQQKQRVCLINPEIIETRGSVCMGEGCLSFPGLYVPVERAAEVTIRAQDVQGEFQQIQADGLLARCILHEIDHINGVVFVDRLSALKRKRALYKLDKQAASR